MKYLKYFNQINEGHITLTADEHKAVERVMKKLPDMFENKLEPSGSSPMQADWFKFIVDLIDSKSNKILYVDTIDYVTAAGIKSKVGVYIVNNENNEVRWEGQYLEGDRQDPNNNIILMNQEGFKSKSFSIQALRTTLIHEFIHAKDPKCNQKETDKYKKIWVKQVYHKRRFEFEAFTGQLLNVISNITYKFLKEGWSSVELKEIFDDILEHFRDTKQDFIDSFLKQNPDFVGQVTSPVYSEIPGIDKYKDRFANLHPNSNYPLTPNTLRFLNREWDKNKSVDITELQNIIYDHFAVDLQSIKEINSDYSEFLKDLYKEIKIQVDFVNSKREEKIELNYKTINDWMKDCQSIVYTSRTKIKKVPI